jgi:hypothetical protein
LGLLGVKSIAAQSQEGLAQQPITSPGMDAHAAGGGFDTSTLMHRRQEANTSNRIRSKPHRSPTFREGVATTDRTSPGAGLIWDTPKLRLWDASPARFAAASLVSVVVSFVVVRLDLAITVEGLAEYETDADDRG